MRNVHAESEYIVQTLFQSCNVYCIANLELSTGLAACLLLLVPDQPTENLTTRALGDGIHKSDATLQELMASLVVFNVLCQSLGQFLIRSRTRSLHNNSLGNLSSAVVGNGDDSNI